MKRPLIFLVAIMLVMATLLTSCGNNPSTSDTTKPDDVVDTANDFVEESPYVVTESLFDAEVSKELYGEFENNKKLTYTQPKESYVMGSVYTIKDCRLLSVTFPIWKTLKPDADGNFTFTLHVFDSRFNGLYIDAKRSYQIKVNAEEFELTANKDKVRKAIKIDLTEYDIVLSGNETVGYYSESDTILAAILFNKTNATTTDNSNTAYQIVREKASYATGSYINVGTANLDYSHNTLMLDFEWEKSYEKKSEYLAMKNNTKYNAMVEALLEKYRGKYVSVVGDSISSFGGLCNDGTANATIANNVAYYPGFGGNVYDYTLMYWGKVIKDLEMQVGVINTWSGSMAYGRSDDVGNNMLVRANNLHRDNGTPNDTSDDIAPDVIIIYFGINDLNGGSPLDKDFEKAIADGYSKSNLDAWFSAVKSKADKVGDIIKGETYASFEQVYALSLDVMKEKYPNAEIYCLTYQESNHQHTTRAKLDKFNKTIKALAEYFDVTVVDQSKDEITWDTCHAYGGDMRALHPSAAGHEVMAENIVKTIYEKNKK